MDWLLTVAMIYTLGYSLLIRFGLDWLTKVFKGKPFISKPILSLLM
jgi:hypothetical protein